jgi:hypothetical protein
MTAKRRPRSKPIPVSGPRGPRGKPGPPGPPGDGDVKKLAAQVEEIVKELQVQLTRIAQIQSQLDRLASGQPPEHTAEHRDGPDRPKY